MYTRWDLIILGETWLGEDDVGVQLAEELGDVYGLSLDFMYNNKQCNVLAFVRPGGRRTSKLKNKEERWKSRPGIRKVKFGSVCVRVRKNISRRNKCEVE
ncbi:hypothetical protein J6590_065176 [Homalodisca vitripennis]|nr:hypothetical protein J6590_065176 [Homalodisca vitripennis]